MAQASDNHAVAPDHPNDVRRHCQSTNSRVRVIADQPEECGDVFETVQVSIIENERETL